MAALAFRLAATARNPLHLFNRQNSHVGLQLMLNYEGAHAQHVLNKARSHLTAFSALSQWSAKYINICAES